MAEMNLLKANITGTLGQVYGAKWKNKTIVKSRPFGVTPHTGYQTRSVRAFERLNRLSVGFAKSFWFYLGLNSKKMLRHNACARYLSPLLTNYTFDPFKFTDIVPYNSNYSMQQPSQAGQLQNITVEFTYNPSLPLPTDTTLHIIAFDLDGYCGQGISVYPGQGPYILKAPQSEGATVFVLSFLTSKHNGKFLQFAGNLQEVNGMQYSLTEQLTGDTWLDGRPIYQRTFTGIMPQDTGILDTNIDTIISVTGYYCDTYSSRISFGSTFGNPVTYSCYIYTSGTALALQAGTSIRGYPYTLTVQYVRP